MRKVTFFTAIFALTTSVLFAQTTKTICNAGCTYTNGTNGANLQTALDALVAGDTLLLQHGYTYKGSFKIKYFVGTTAPTIRTGVSATGVVTSIGTFPAAGVRVTAALAASNNFAKLQALNANEPALSTANPSGGNTPAYYTIRFLEFLSNAGLVGSGTIIQCGSDSNTLVTQVSEIPHHITFDQNYVHGDAVIGQFRGISWHCSNSAITNNSVLDIKSLEEGQALFLNSYDTTVMVRNNDLSGGAEVVIQGGSSGAARAGSSVVSASSATSMTLAGHLDLHVGQNISVETDGVTEEETEVVSCGTSTPGALCTSDAITVPANTLSGTPIAGADVDWGLVPANLTLSKNHIWRPVSYRNAILGTPQSLAGTPSATGGTIAAGPRSYRVVAYMPTAGQSSQGSARSAASAEITVTTTGTTSSVALTWTAVPNATSYRVYFGSAGGENAYYTTATNSYTDTGAAGTAGAVPTSAGSVWFVKNLLELKNGENIIVEGNVIENTWLGGQTGFSLTLTPANTGNGNDSTRLQDVTVRNNIFRNAAGGIQMTARDVSTNNQPSGRARRITVSNNLWYNINTSWGSSLQSVIISSRSQNSMYPGSGHTMAPDAFNFDHNTFIHTSGNSMLWYDLFKGSVTWPCTNCSWTNSIAYKLSYGLTGANSCTQGAGCWNTYNTGTPVWQNNVVCDAVAANYPGGATETLAPTCTNLQSEFQNFAANDFRLKTTSPYHNAATDGTDIGAIIPTITALTDIAESGNDSGGTVVVPPSITTLSIGNGQVSTPYSATFSGTCPVTPCTWSASGVPSGLTFTSVSSTQATLTGTPLVAGSPTIAVTLTSGTPLATTQNYTITIACAPSGPGDTDPDAPPVVNENRADRYNLDEGVFFRRPTNPCTDGEPCRLGDGWSDTSTTPPTFKILTQLSPTAVWSSVGGGGSSVGFMNLSFFITVSGQYSTWTLTANTTAADLFGAGRYKPMTDLTGYTQCRLYARVGTAVAGVTATAYAQYSTDNGATWADLGTTAATPAFDLAGSSATGGDTTVGWQNIAAGAKAEVLLRVVANTSAGTITTQPQLGLVGMNCK